MSNIVTGWLFVAPLAVSLFASGCATSARPLHVTRRVALTPEKGQVTVQARAGKPIGDIVPVDLAIANGTDEPYLIQPSQVFAVDEQGEKILTVPTEEAIQEAGDAKALKAGLTGAAKNAAVGAIAGAVIGAGLGVAIGAVLGSPAAGAAYGAAMGGGIGAAEAGVAGGVQGQAAAHQDAASQITALSLQTGEAQPNFSVNGYVFFPKGTYSSIQLNIVDEETHDTATATAPWNENGAKATATTLSPDRPAVQVPALRAAQATTNTATSSPTQHDETSDQSTQSSASHNGLTE